MDTILALGDLHLPWVHADSLSRVYAAIERHKPKHVVQIGDAYDMFSLGRWARSQNVCTPKQELEEARQGYMALWKNIRRMVPKAECHQLLGNHDARPTKMVLERFPEIESLVRIEDLFKSPGVQVCADDRQELIIQGICFMHGFRAKLGMHMRYNGMSTVCGHSHQGGVVFEKFFRGRTLFELNCGYLGDPNSIALSYSKQTFTKWTHGYGVIDADGPRFCPLPFTA